MTELRRVYRILTKQIPRDSNRWHTHTYSRLLILDWVRYGLFVFLFFSALKLPEILNFFVNHILFTFFMAVTAGGLLAGEKREEQIKKYDPYFPPEAGLEGLEYKLHQPISSLFKRNNFSPESG